MVISVASFNEYMCMVSGEAEAVNQMQKSSTNENMVLTHSKSYQITLQRYYAGKNLKLWGETS